MLNKKIENIKNKYYLQNNREEFDQLCKQKLELPQEILNYCQKNHIEIIDCSEEDEPSWVWTFTYPRYEEGKFKVSYRSELNISKLEQLFSLTHEATVKNIDPNRYDPDISDSTNSVALNKYQFFIDESLVTNFKNYDRMWWIDCVQVVPDLIFKDSDNILSYDSKVTNDNLAFENLLDEIEPENKYEYDENTFGF